MESFVICTFIITSNCVFGQIRYSVPEEQEAGIFIGNVASDLSLDVKALSQRKFGIVSSAQRPDFELNPATGDLLIKDRLDREHLCGKKNVCVTNLEIMLKNPLELYHVEINILDINDNAPTFREAEMVLNISETVIPGSMFPMKSAYDPDIGSNSVSFYQLNPNRHFVLKSRNPRDSNKLPELVLEQALDREQKKTHSLILTAYDGGHPQYSAVAKIIVNVLDANDNHPIFDQNHYIVKLEENVPGGTLLIKMNASDADEDTNAKIVYGFSDNTALKALELFSINPESGYITIDGLVDYEEETMYELYVKATDKGPYAEGAHCKVVVEVVDVNDNTPEITIRSESSKISEDAAVGTVVALIRVQDKDSGPNGLVQCRISENLPFQLKPSLNNYYSLVTRKILDREVQSEYNVSILASDQGSPVRSVRKAIFVQIDDVNDNQPSFVKTEYEIHLSENNFPGSSIGRVTAEDADTGQNARISYSVSGKKIDNKPILSYFSVGTEDGIIYAMTSFDYEKQREYQFQMEARDAGIPQLTSIVIIKVYVEDANDNPPEILHPFPGKGSEGTRTVPKSANAGYLVTKVVAVDADVGHNAWLSYHLLTGTAPELFSVAKYTGEVRTARQFLSNDSAYHNLVIMVKDNGQPALSTTAVVHVSLMDTLPEAPQKLDRQPHHQEGGVSDVNLYLIICLLSVLFVFVIVVSVTFALRCYSAQWRNDNSSVYHQTSSFLVAQHLQGLQTFIEVNENSSVSKVGTLMTSVPEALKDDFITINHPGATKPRPSVQQFQQAYLLCGDNIGSLSRSEGIIQQRWSGTLGQQMQAV